MPLIRKDTPASAPSSGLDPTEQLKSSNADERWAAARALAREPKNVALLAEALAVERDARVREVLLTGLARMHSEDAVTAILPLVRSDDAAIRTGALDALNAMPGAVESIIPKLLADPDADVRLLLCDTVRRLPEPVASRHLCALLERESAPNVCAAAIEALCEVGDAEALPVLARCAQRFPEEPFLVFSIKVAVERIGASRA